MNGDLTVLLSYVLRLALLLQPRRQLAERQEAAVLRFHLIRHRPLQNDLGPRVVGDFHQAGSEGELVAEGNEGLGIGD